MISIMKNVLKMLNRIFLSEGKSSNNEEYHSSSLKSYGGMPASPSVSDIGSGINGMNFVIYSAIGGKVIEFSQYDPIRDRNLKNLYIITDREDLGEELGQIITKESLTR